MHRSQTACRGPIGKCLDAQKPGCLSWTHRQMLGCTEAILRWKTIGVALFLDHITHWKFQVCCQKSRQESAHAHTFGEDFELQILRMCRFLSRILDHGPVYGCTAWLMGITSNLKNSLHRGLQVGCHLRNVTGFAKTRHKEVEHVFMYKLIKNNISINMYTEVIFVWSEPFHLILQTQNISVMNKSRVHKGEYPTPHQS